MNKQEIKTWMRENAWRHMECGELNADTLAAAAQAAHPHDTLASSTAGAIERTELIAIANEVIAERETGGIKPGDVQPDPLVAQLVEASAKALDYFSEDELEQYAGSQRDRARGVLDKAAKAFESLPAKTRLAEVYETNEDVRVACAILFGLGFNFADHAGDQVGALAKQARKKLAAVPQ